MKPTWKGPMTFSGTAWVQNRDLEDLMHQLKGNVDWIDVSFHGVEDDYHNKVTITVTIDKPATKSYGPWKDDD